MTSDFKPEVVMWSKLRMRSEKSPKIGFTGIPYTACNTDAV